MIKTGDLSVYGHFKPRKFLGWILVSNLSQSYNGRYLEEIKDVLWTKPESILFECKEQEGEMTSV